MAAVSVSHFCWVVISLRNPEISETLKTNISQQCWDEHTALISGENGEVTFEIMSYKLQIITWKNARTWQMEEGREEDKYERNVIV